MPSEQDSEAAARAIARLEELSADLRGAAILDSEGELLVARPESDEWAEGGRALIDAARGALGREPAMAHVGEPDGEAFAVCEDGRWCIAVTERFTLASLVTFDMRTVLRELAAELEPA